MWMFAVLGLLGAAEAALLPAWEFEDASALEVWVPNAHLDNVGVADGVLKARAVDWDPFFHCRGIEIPAAPWQYVLVRMRADRGGTGELFWSGVTEGQYGGLTQKKRTSFQVPGDGAWHEIAIFPFWHPEQVVRQLRLDVYPDAEFEIDWIRVQSWGEGDEPIQDTYTWSFPDGDLAAWEIAPRGPERFSPPLDLPLGKRGFVVVRMSAQQDSEGQVLWAAPQTAGLQSESFAIRCDGRARDYNVEVHSFPSWGDRIVALGLRIPDLPGMRVESVTLSEAPVGPADLHVVYFGFENAPNRAGKPMRILAHIENRGGDVER
ncbi:MAG TPA: hypothetical protein PKL84_05440, partial [Candidatus Hydrogenedentes bacterium]|nr:hypothetical protein [Candidatus Hydrogenedentota bacterium]